MKCTKCGMDVVIPAKVFRNLETYNVGGSTLIASECCGAGYEVHMTYSFKKNPYTGSKTEDDWGNKINAK